MPAGFNEDPAIVREVPQVLYNFMSEYGWFVLGGLILLYILVQAIRRVASSRGARKERPVRPSPSDAQHEARRRAAWEVRQGALASDAEEFVLKRREDDERLRRRRLEDLERKAESYGFKPPGKPYKLNADAEIPDYWRNMSM